MDAEQLQAQLEEAQKKIEELSKGGGLSDEEKKRLAHLEAENKDLISARDKAKQKAREEEEARLAAQGEYKTIAERVQAEKDALAKQLEEYNTTLNGYKKRDEEKFEALKAQVPEALRDTLDDSIPLAKRIELAEKLIGTKSTAPKTRTAGEQTDNTMSRAEFDSLDHAQRQKFFKDGGKLSD